MYNVYSQSRQSARLFLQSSELGLPQPRHPQVSGVGGWGGAHSLAGVGVGVGGPNSDEGTDNCGTLGIYVCIL
jgi:hypothetical protein